MPPGLPAVCPHLHGPTFSTHHGRSPALTVVRGSRYRVNCTAVLLLCSAARFAPPFCWTYVSRPSHFLWWRRGGDGGDGGPFGGDGGDGGDGGGSGAMRAVTENSTHPFVLARVVPIVVVAPHASGVAGGARCARASPCSVEHATPTPEGGVSRNSQVDLTGSAFANNPKRGRKPIYRARFRSRARLRDKLIKIR